MKTEIIIEGIVYKVGDVLEREFNVPCKIVCIGATGFFYECENPHLVNGIITFFDAKNWKIRKPKKKVVVERWINIDKDGHVGAFKDEATANCCKNSDRIACEYVRFEYEIDE